MLCVLLAFRHCVESLKVMKPTSWRAIRARSQSHIESLGNEEARLINVGSVKNKLASLLTHEIVLSTDSATNYKAFAKKKGIPEITNSNKGEHVKKGVYHIQHVNAYHQRLKKWME